MENQRNLLIHGSESALKFVSESVEKYIQALLLLSERERVEQARKGNDPCPALLDSEERAVSQPQLIKSMARAFLEQYVSSAVLEVFPEWQGILIDFPALEKTVWVVRDRQDGQRLTQETGRPFILFDDFLAQAELLIQRTFLGTEHSEGEIS